MNREDAAKALNGRQYGNEIDKTFEQALKAAGLVAVFGYSDDNMEFRGAIHDEVGCWDGGMAYLTRAGMLANDCENDECPHFAKLKEKAATIEAKWSDGGFSWRYETAIPHDKFVIKEDDDDYCEGIVFALVDVPA